MEAEKVRGVTNIASATHSVHPYVRCQHVNWLFTNPMLNFCMINEHMDLHIDKRFFAHPALKSSMGS